MCVCEWVNVWGSLSAYLGGELLEELVELILVLVNVNVEWSARHMDSRPLDIYLIIPSLNIKPTTKPIRK